MALTAVGEIDLNVVSMGSGDTVVLIHGLLLGSLAQWYFTLAPALADRFRVLLYDQRGHGRSSLAPRGYDLATLAGDLDSLVTEPPILVGHSYGGLVALTYARLHPVRKLVLIDVPLPPSEATVFADRTPEELMSLLPPGALGEGRRFRRKVEALARLVGETSVLDDVRAEADLEVALEVPTLAIYGEDSLCLPTGERLRAAGATLVTVPGGHFVPTEAPGPMVEAVVSWLR